MGWFKRLKEGVSTETIHKKSAPDGLWHQCKKCNETFTSKDLAENFHKCPHCNYHNRITPELYFEIIFDGGKYKELFSEIQSKDFLNFTDLRPYSDRLTEAKAAKPGKEAIVTAVGKVKKRELVVAAMDFFYIGGSMGSVVGEKIAMSIEYCLEHKVPLMIISKSGGARMMESAFSLMQMAKTSAMLTKLGKAGIPFFSFMTDPTTGGVTASYAMLGDLNFAEPGALIGFAGPRVIKEFIRKDLPEGFQTSEFLLEHGFLDFIVDRKDLRERMGDLLQLFRMDEHVEEIMAEPDAETAGKPVEN